MRLIDQLPRGIHIFIGDDLNSAHPVVGIEATTRAKAKLTDQVLLHAGVSKPQSFHADDCVDIDGDLNDLFHESSTIQTGLSNIVSRETLISFQRADPFWLHCLCWVNRRMGYLWNATHSMVMAFCFGLGETCTVVHT